MSKLLTAGVVETKRFELDLTDANRTLSQLSYVPTYDLNILTFCLFKFKP